jgi:hypothetical protein
LWSSQWLHKTHSINLTFILKPIILLLILLWWTINISLLTIFLLTCLKVKELIKCVIINTTSNKIAFQLKQHINIGSYGHYNSIIKHCILNTIVSTVTSPPFAPRDDVVLRLGGSLMTLSNVSLCWDSKCRVL